MPESDERDVVRKSGMVYAAIFSLASSVLVCLMVGWALDKWLKTSPWLLVAGIVLGSVAGFYQFVRLISKIN